MLTLRPSIDPSVDTSDFAPDTVESLSIPITDVKVNIKLIDR